jgi:hypothetical protein
MLGNVYRGSGRLLGQRLKGIVDPMGNIQRILKIVSTMLKE